MTATAPARSERLWGLPEALRVAVALMAAVTVMLVGLAGLFASPVSARPLTGPGNAVAVFGAAAGQVVGTHELVMAGQCRARAPNYDQTAVCSCVAAEDASALTRAPGMEPNPVNMTDLTPPDATVFAGHGAFIEANGMTVVPEGTSITFPATLGETITNQLGAQIETGTEAGLPGEWTAGPGESVPNMTLFPGPVESTGSVWAGEPTNLSELMRPNMGACFWAACMSVLEPGA